MAKVRAYFRVGKTSSYKFKVDAGVKQNDNPLHRNGTYGEKVFLPTVMFAVDFEIDDALFNRASKVVGTINVNAANAVIAAELPTAKELKLKKK